MNLSFKKLEQASMEVVEAFNRWDNDPQLVPFIRPVKNREEFKRFEMTTIESLEERLQNHQVFLIYLNDRLIGSMDYMVDPKHLLRKVTGTAWIAITIGEKEARGKGIGFKALQALEEEIHKAGLKRIELGVFEFNTPAQKLYRKLGYREIGRIKEFTYWQGKMWDDIRMEKILKE